MPIADLALVRVGSRVAYEDRANPRSCGEVIAVDDNPWSPYTIRWLEGPRSGETTTSDCRQHGWWLTDLAGTDIIHAYTRQQAIADGVLVPIDADTLGEDMAQQAGWLYPCAMTRTMWDRYVEVPEGAVGQDVKGRLWDILWMAGMEARRLKARGESGSEFRFRWSCVVREDGRLGGRQVTAKAVAGPDDNAEPCITFMLPEED